MIRIRGGRFVEAENLHCSTGIETAAIIGAAATVGSMGMSIIGGFQQADAQRAAGEAAYNNALQRQQMLESEAKQREAEAKEQQAVSQRRAIAQKRKANIVAGRAQAVMAASGAGVDDSIISGILDEGELGFDSALWEGDSRAGKLNYQATLNRFDGSEGVRRGAHTRSVMQSRAANTEFSTVGKALFQGASLAAKYGGDFFSSGSAGSPVSPRSAMDDYGKMPNSWRAPGLDGYEYGGYSELA